MAGKRYEVKRTAVRSVNSSQVRSSENTTVQGMKRNEVVKPTSPKVIPQQAAAMRASIRRAQKAVGSDGRVVTTNQ